MDDPADPVRVSPAAFLYRPSAFGDLVEVASVQGCAVALPVHFHEEDQVTFVALGRRRFQIGDRVVELAPGQAAFIEAGMPHSSLAELEPVVCFNAYLPPGDDAEGLVAAMRQRWDGDEGVTRHDAAQSNQQASARLVTVLGAATRAGMSREGFSRAFRRTHGVAPSVFRSLARLNHARRLLRLGVPLAAAAAEAGFADQSHFGRCFRRAFGVTPGGYRTAWSHLFQTGTA